MAVTVPTIAMAASRGAIGEWRRRRGEIAGIGLFIQRGVPPAPRRTARARFDSIKAAS
jgi:hypothetical protein